MDADTNVAAAAENQPIAEPVANNEPAPAPEPVQSETAPTPVANDAPAPAADTGVRSAGRTGAPWHLSFYGEIHHCGTAAGGRGVAGKIADGACGHWKPQHLRFISPNAVVHMHLLR